MMIYTNCNRIVYNMSSRLYVCVYSSNLGEVSLVSVKATNFTYWLHFLLDSNSNSVLICSAQGLVAFFEGNKITEDRGTEITRSVFSRRMNIASKSVHFII